MVADLVTNAVGGTAVNSATKSVESLRFPATTALHTHTDTRGTAGRYFW